MIRAVLGLVLLMLSAFVPVAAQTATGRDAQGRLLVDVEIVFAGDASGSIDDTEWRLQRDGHAVAITDPEVLQAIASGEHGRIAVAYIEWGAPFLAGIAVDWHVIADRASAEAFARLLRTNPRQSFAYNSISLGIRIATQQIVENEFEGTRKVIDVSGDGPQLYGPDIKEVRAAAVRHGITINAIAINTQYGEMHGPPGTSLREHYQNEIIAGPNAFVMEVGDDARFDRVLINKIRREVAQLR